MRELINILNESASGSDYSTYSVRWSELDKKGYIVTKEKFFNTSKSLDLFLEKLENKDNFHEILAYSYPKEKVEENASCGSTSSGSISAIPSVLAGGDQFFGGDPSSSIYPVIKRNRHKKKHVIEAKNVIFQNYKKELNNKGYKLDKDSYRQASAVTEQVKYNHQDGSFYMITILTDDVKFPGGIKMRAGSIKSWHYHGKGGTKTSNKYYPENAEKDLIIHLNKNKKDTPPTKIPRRSSEQKRKDNFVMYD